MSMGIAGALVVYFMTFWVVLFAVLPWGNKPVENPQAGNTASAPANPHLKIKFLVTALISAVILAIVYGLINSGILDFHDIANQMAEEDGL